uniref:rap1 GTPase-activating protein 2-like n=1 Tax=Callithrix jacchus TaxID=9483 RepID=UPI0023DD0AB5|nr:rap1 GTPase-activating protein 2-like [Callithrix jacchus]
MRQHQLEWTDPLKQQPAAEATSFNLDETQDSKKKLGQSSSEPPVVAATAKNQSRSPIKRRSRLFPHLHTGLEGQGDSRARCDSVSSTPKTPDSGHSSQEIKSETSSNPSSLEICPNKEKRLRSSQPSTSPFRQEVFVYSPSMSSESPSLGAAATPIIMSQSPTDAKSRNSPRSNLKFCFDKLSHASSGAGSPVLPGEGSCSSSLRVPNTTLTAPGPPPHRPPAHIPAINLGIPGGHSPACAATDMPSKYLLSLDEASFLKFLLPDLPV